MFEMCIYVLTSAQMQLGVFPEFYPQNLFWMVSTSWYREVRNTHTFQLSALAY